MTNKNQKTNSHSCSTTGSSLNHIARLYNEMGKSPSGKWSVIDRWPEWDGLVEAMAECTKAGLDQIPLQGKKFFVRKILDFEKIF